MMAETNNQTLLEFARTYYLRGWLPLPVPYRSKNPGFKGWQYFTVNEADLPQHFNGRPQNIGVLLGKASGNLIDVDLDCAEAVMLAPFFLPPTGAVFGRLTRQRSHWLYISPIPNKITFTNPVTGKRLVEILTNGQQAIFPGSSHQDTGELVQWYENGEPASISEHDVVQSVRRLAAATLIACQWPQEGSRNDAALALAGGLLRAGWSEKETAHFIESVCTAANDEETHARVRSVVDTAAKLKDGAHVTGWPTLAKLLSDVVIERVRQWLELPVGASASSSSTAAKDAGTKAVESALRVVRMADVEPEDVLWLWHPYIALGKLTILEGDPGLGKSWLTCALASAISNGRGLPGAEPFEAGDVLMLSAEDGKADTLRPRLNAIGADVKRVFALDEPLTLDEVGLIRLEATIIEYKPILLIIDPLFAYTGGTVDIHRANECRAISAPLAAIAERQGCAILALRHLTKSAGRTAMSAGIGSIDIRAAARSVLLVGSDPDDPTRRAIVQTKNNLAMEGHSICYKIEDGQFWWTGESELTASRIFSSASDDDSRTAQTDAMAYLKETLGTEPRPAKEMKSEMLQAGFTDQVIRRAREKLGVRVYKEGGHFGNNGQRWMWELRAAEDVQVRGNEHLQSNAKDKNTYSNDLAEDVHCDVFEHLQADGLTSSGDCNPLTDEEAELAARLEFMEHVPRPEAERRAREWYAPTPF
jgi:DNA repair protein RadA/Sms